MAVPFQASMGAITAYAELSVHLPAGIAVTKAPRSARAKTSLPSALSQSIESVRR